MSDTFDHMSDAYNQYVLMEESEECLSIHRKTFNTNYLFHHRKKYYYEIKAETQKAYLIHFLCMKEPVWVPKRLCLNMNKKEQSVWVWKNTKNVVTHQTKSVITAWKKK
jgi:hypothetical protein